MTNENSNNFSWKNKLEDVNDLSGEIFLDKNEAWEKLHDRLHKKPSRVKPLWYWIAAACLLTAIITPVLVINKKQTITAKLVKIKSPSTGLSASQILPEKEIATADIPVVSNQKGKIKTTRESIANRKIFPNISLVKDSNIAVITDDKKDILFTPPISPETVTEKLVEAVPAVAVVKKKLKVVHVNELGDPVQEDPDMARIAYNRSSQSRFLNREVFMNPAHTSYSTSFNIFKTKNTPPN